MRAKLGIAVAVVATGATAFLLLGKEPLAPSVGARPATARTVAASNRLVPSALTPPGAAPATLLAPGGSGMPPSGSLATTTPSAPAAYAAPLPQPTPDPITPAGFVALLRGKPLPLAVSDALSHKGALRDRAVLEALLAFATQRTAAPDERAAALEVLARSPVLAADDLARVAAIAIAPDEAPRTRTAAVVALRQLSLTRADLTAPARAALLDAADKAPSAEVRADALDSIRARGASPDDLARLIAFLRDPDARVRAGAARSLAGADPARRASVSDAVSAALTTESDFDTTRALLAAR